MSLTRRGKTVRYVATAAVGLAIGAALGYRSTAATYALRALCCVVLIVVAVGVINLVLDKVEARAERRYQAQQGLRYLEKRSNVRGRL